MQYLTFSGTKNGNTAPSNRWVQSKHTQIYTQYYTVCRRNTQREQQAAEPPQDRHAKGVTSPDLGRDGQQVLVKIGSC